MANDTLIKTKRALFLKALKKDKDLKPYKQGIQAIENLPLNSFKTFIKILLKNKKTINISKTKTEAKV